MSFFVWTEFLSSWIVRNFCVNSVYCRCAARFLGNFRIVRISSELKCYFCSGSDEFCFGAISTSVLVPLVVCCFAELLSSPLLSGGFQVLGRARKFRTRFQSLIRLDDYFEEMKR
ncbi:hypothetical protein MA16_Dca013495 [Dendrobium catenatum]|nr:hypothetical protein MA16_Dca013495 [Dendrobium catenatum]